MWSRSILAANAAWAPDRSILFLQLRTLPTRKRSKANKARKGPSIEDSLTQMPSCSSFGSTLSGVCSMQWPFCKKGRCRPSRWSIWERKTSLASNVCRVVWQGLSESTWIFSVQVSIECYNCRYRTWATALSQATIQGSARGRKPSNPCNCKAGSGADPHRSKTGMSSPPPYSNASFQHQYLLFAPLGLNPRHLFRNQSNHLAYQFHYQLSLALVQAHLPVSGYSLPFHLRVDDCHLSFN